MSRRLIFLGPPGTGKGTQAARIADRFHLAKIASGDALRREIGAETELGKQVAEYVESGRLVPDELITDVMLTAIEAAGADFILDGFPRTVPQAEALDAGLGACGAAVDAVVCFAMAPADIIKRIASRRICSNCQTPYNLLFVPPKQDGVCDRCSGKLLQRVDDREDVVRTRLETYEKNTAPLSEYYSTRGLLRRVDASLAPDEVETQIMGIVTGLGSDV